jgi:hypothetical protein
MKTNGSILESLRERRQDTNEAKATDKRNEWITIRGTHIYVDGDGNLTGKVGETISSNSGTSKTTSNPLDNKPIYKLDKKEMDQVEQYLMSGEKGKKVFQLKAEITLIYQDRIFSPPKRGTKTGYGVSDSEDMRLRKSMSKKYGVSEDEACAVMWNTLNQLHDRNK